MTELEKHIIEVARPVMEERRAKMESWKTECSRIETLFVCDGVFDILVWDREKHDFVAIRYWVGMGKGTVFDKHCGYYHRTKMKTLIL